jgi:4-amino-4-deoxy-L-arabinose transferase-like glycosyltransferase
MSIDRRMILAVFAIALGVRILYAAAVTTDPTLNPNAVTPELTYAQAIAGGFEWLQTPHSPLAPGYPILLAAFYLLSVKTMWIMILLQTVVGALTVVVAFKVGVFLLGRLLGSIAALWLALSVHQIHYASILRRDVLSVLLLLLLLYVLGRPLKKMRFAVIAGVIYVCLVHVDPQFVLLLPLFCLFVFFKTRHTLLNLQYFFLFVGTVVALSAPMTLRNYAVYGSPVPIALEASRYFRPVRHIARQREMTLSRAEEGMAQASLISSIQRNAVEFWRFARFRDQIEPSDDPNKVQVAEPAWSLRHNAVSIISYGLLLPFFLLGVYAVFRDRRRMGIVLASTTVVYFLMRTFLGGSEHARFPAEPLIILLAFYGVFAIIKVLGSSRAQPEKPA